MSPRVVKLRMLVRLRRGDVDRRARATAVCAKALDAAEAALAAARNRVTAAETKKARALEERLRVPSDPVVGWYCDGCEEQLADARGSLAYADRAVAAAAEELVAARKQWLRAQARCDAMAAMLTRAITDHRRAGERRRLDAIIDDRRTPVFA